MYNLVYKEIYNYSWQATIQWNTDTIKKHWDKKKKV